MYEDTRRDHAEVIGQAEHITDGALAELTGRADSGGRHHPIVVWNSLSHPRTGLVEAEVPAELNACS